MACPSDITVTLHHKCTSPEGECAKEHTTTVNLTDILSAFSDSVDLYGMPFAPEDLLNETIQRMMGLLK